MERVCVQVHSGLCPTVDRNPAGGAGLNAEVSCRAVLGAGTSAVRGLAESTAVPGRGCALGWSWPAELDHLLGDYSEEPPRWVLTESVRV